ncbi:hypothetical protein SAMN06265795_12916 [Noviherbaspirillum humi]|uniref:Uncharacterized protein n=1 Tax=Noviherbaspirillum humi TaxID=1688639 RepID=A0A239M2S3_9BURK|nr:hypothetical protein [Noviherbaspirillum humi]SNT36179.1 hypothetical protein SAMN06265795_12916 [Noviherbaspirillum humi]
MEVPPVLGDKAEDAFRQAMIAGEGAASVFWSNPLVTTMMVIGCALLSLPLLSLPLLSLLLRRQKAQGSTLPA